MHIFKRKLRKKCFFFIRPKCLSSTIVLHVIIILQYPTKTQHSCIRQLDFYEFLTPWADSFVLATWRKSGLIGRSVCPRFVCPPVIVAEPRSSGDRTHGKHLLLRRVHWFVLNEKFGQQNGRCREQTAGGWEILTLAALSPGGGGGKDSMMKCESGNPSISVFITSLLLMIYCKKKKKVFVTHLKNHLMWQNLLATFEKLLPWSVLHCNISVLHNSSANGNCRIPFQGDGEAAVARLCESEKGRGVDGDKHLHGQSQLDLSQSTRDDEWHGPGRSWQTRVVALTQRVWWKIAFLIWNQSAR